MESLIDKFFKSRGLKLVVVFLLILFVIVSVFNRIREGDCSSTYRDHFINEFYSKVEGKFISKNHAFQVVQLENSEDLYAIGFEKTGLYNFVEVGDTILKKCNTLEYIVIRNGDHFSFKVNISDCEKFKI